ncbi:STAS domain-containing protein [Actinomadura rubrisoli]|uniref:STAS domain-containing protein n=1 Tax=Actinomadura rubrisoli TaxID=2530368 RepID=UPI001404CD69|nr:STAS domain-containing protein [Actinomadura rubrisoli]
MGRDTRGDSHGSGSMAGLRLEPLSQNTGLAVSGQIDVRSRDLWESALERLADAGPPEIRLELAELETVDAGGAAALVAAADRLDGGGRVVLCDPPRALCRILQVLWPDATGIEVWGQ